MRVLALFALLLLPVAASATEPVRVLRVEGYAPPVVIEERPVNLLVLKQRVPARVRIDGGPNLTIIQRRGLLPLRRDVTVIRR